MFWALLHSKTYVCDVIYFQFSKKLLYNLFIRCLFVTILMFSVCHKNTLHLYYISWFLHCFLTDSKVIRNLSNLMDSGWRMKRILKKIPGNCLKSKFSSGNSSFYVFVRESKLDEWWKWVTKYHIFKYWCIFCEKWNVHNSNSQISSLLITWVIYYDLM